MPISGRNAGDHGTGGLRRACSSDARDRAPAGRADGRFHLHSLHDSDHVAFLDAVAIGYTPNLERAGKRGSDGARPFVGRGLRFRRSAIQTGRGKPAQKRGRKAYFGSAPGDLDMRAEQRLGRAGGGRRRGLEGWR